MKISLHIIFALILSSFSVVSHGLDFRSIAVEAAILYDAPSVNAKKIYVISQNYPVEIVVELQGWCKIRDSVGELSWIEKKDLTSKRTVLVAVSVATIYQAADAKSTVLFQAEKNVVLEMVDQGITGWIKVKHRDGQIGFIPVAQVWGV